MNSLLLSLVLTVGTLGARYASESQALSRAAPTVASFTSTASLELNGLTGFRVMVCAESGQTLSGAGTLQAYLLDEYSGLVARNPALDVSVTATTRCQAFPDLTVTGSRAEGRTIFAANSVTVSGGTTVTVYYRGFAAKADQ